MRLVFSLAETLCSNFQESTKSSFASDAQASIVDEPGPATSLMLSARSAGESLPPVSAYNMTGISNIQHLVEPDIYPLRRAD